MTPNRRPGSPSWDTAQLRARLRADGFEPGGDLPPIAWFGDGPELADELGELVRAGRKTATASLLWRWEAEGGLPRAGDRQLIINWSGEPLAVIEMTEVTVVPFDQVDAEFARAEGEGDLSLGYWREVHWDFFSRECERLGRAPEMKMPAVCMRFRVVHATSR